MQKDIYVSSFCINTGKTVYFSKHTHPDMSVIDAVLMSSSVPILFSTIKLNKEMYIDGALNERWPAEPFIGKNPKHVTKLCLNYHEKLYCEINTIKDFVEAIINTLLRNRNSYPMECNSYEIDVSDYNIFDFNMPYEDKLRMYISSSE